MATVNKSNKTKANFPSAPEKKQHKPDSIIRIKQLEGKTETEISSCEENMNHWMSAGFVSLSSAHSVSCSMETVSLETAKVSGQCEEARVETLQFFSRSISEPTQPPPPLLLLSGPSELITGSADSWLRPTSLKSREACD